MSTAERIPTIETRRPVDTSEESKKMTGWILDGVYDDLVEIIAESRGMSPEKIRALIDDGCDLCPAGEAKEDPLGLFSSGYTPRYKFSLFGTEFFLSSQREDENFRFFVAYISTPPARGRRRVFVPRILYKDQSLIWRCATHFIHSDHENWIGKGDLKMALVDGVEMECTAEETTRRAGEEGMLNDLASGANRDRLDERSDRSDSSVRSDGGFGGRLRWKQAFQVRPGSDHCSTETAAN